MLLDYKKIDPELLPALEDFPALDLNRDNIVKMRELLAQRPTVPSAVAVSEEEQVIDTKDGALSVFIYRKTNAPTNPRCSGCMVVDISLEMRKTSARGSSRMPLIALLFPSITDWHQRRHFPPGLTIVTRH